jgi:hypothetical protein
MKIEEYKEWLIDNGNKEEEYAYEVTKEIVNWHTLHIDISVDVNCYPRKIIQTRREKIEFDLVIQLEWYSNHYYKRLIGVEFKDTDVEKVIDQAIIRRRFVDYMYIATANIAINPEQLLRIVDYGIGWVVWGKDFTKLVFLSKFQRHGRSEILIKYLAKKAVEEVIQEMIEDGKTSKLFQFMEI